MRRRATDPLPRPQARGSLPRRPFALAPCALPLLALVLAMLPAPGCAQLQDMLGRPTARVAGASLRGLDMTGVDVVLEVAVSNPYTVALPLLGLDYELGHGGSTLVRGTSEAGGSVPAHGTRTLPVTARVDFASLPALVKDLVPGSVVDYVASLGLSVDAPGVGNLRLPIEHAGSFPVPAVPEVTLSALRWEKLTMSAATAVLDVGIRNTNAFGVDLSELAYELKLGGTPVASGAADGGLKLEGGDTGTLKLKLSLKPADLGLAAFQMLGSSGAGYDLRGRMSLGTDFGPLDLPYSRQGQVSFTR